MRASVLDELRGVRGGKADREYLEHLYAMIRTLGFILLFKKQTNKKTMECCKQRSHIT